MKISKLLFYLLLSVGLCGCGLFASDDKDDGNSDTFKIYFEESVFAGGTMKVGVSGGQTNFVELYINGERLSRVTDYEGSGFEVNIPASLSGLCEIYMTTEESDKQQLAGTVKVYASADGSINTFEPTGIDIEKASVIFAAVNHLDVSESYKTNSLFGIDQSTDKIYAVEFTNGSERMPITGDCRLYDVSELFAYLDCEIVTRYTPVECDDTDYTAHRMADGCKAYAAFVRKTDGMLYETELHGLCSFQAPEPYTVFASTASSYENNVSKPIYKISLYDSDESHGIMAESAIPENVFITGGGSNCWVA